MNRLSGIGGWEMTRNFRGGFGRGDFGRDFGRRDFDRDFGRRDFDRDFRRRDFDRGFDGFGEFGGPFIGGFAGSLLGNALFPGYGYGYGGYPYYGYPAVRLSTIWLLRSLLIMKTREATGFSVASRVFIYPTVRITMN